MINTFIKVTFIITILFLVSCTQHGKGYFIPPQVIKASVLAQEHSIEKQKIVGKSDIAISHTGRFWATWCTASSQYSDINNHVVVASSNDKGNTWEEVLIIDTSGKIPLSVLNPYLWVDPDGKLWIFWTQQTKQPKLVSSGTWSLTIENPDVDEPKWGKPTYLVDGIIVDRPTLLSNGECIMPISTDLGAATVASTDHGKTWHLKSILKLSGDERKSEEHKIIERKDGSLWMLISTKYGIMESVSFNRGINWSPPTPTKITELGIRFFILRLYSGDLLMIKQVPATKAKNSSLIAFVSSDEGTTWKGGLLIAEGTNLSCHNGIQENDSLFPCCAKIHVIYGFNRISNQEVLLSNFKEDDVLYRIDSNIVSLPVGI